MARTDKAEKISITLPPDMLNEIKEQVKLGHYGSTSEVIREAMRLWQRQEEEHLERIASIRKRLKHSAKNGKPVPIEEAFGEIEEHHQKRMNAKNEKYEVFLTPDAILDLKTIYDYIADASGFPEVAWRYIEKLKEKCFDLQTAPLRGHKRDDLRKHLRIVAIDEKAVAAFEVDEKIRTVTILNIFYGGRDYDTLMRD